jgi:hypothetical protein
VKRLVIGRQWYNDPDKATEQEHEQFLGARAWEEFGSNEARPTTLTRLSWMERVDFVKLKGDSAKVGAATRSIDMKKLSMLTFSYISTKTIHIIVEEASYNKTIEEKKGFN